MNRNEPIHTVRELTPRRAVLETLARAQDRWAEAEQMHRLAGNEPMAEEAHRVAVRILRAYLVESDDPKPKGLA
jgi:hypothetical protein